MKQKYKEGYTVVGYIAREEITTGFLRPIYRNNQQLFTHELYGNNQRIRSFTPFGKKLKKDSFDRIRGFTPYGGPKKGIDDPAFIIFKYGGLTTFASSDDKDLIEALKALLPQLPRDAVHECRLCEDIEKLLQCVPMPM